MRIFQRQYHVIPLAPIVGYHHYRYGSSGIEHTLNDLLSGEQQISLDQRNWHYGLEAYLPAVITYSSRWIHNCNKKPTNFWKTTPALWCSLMGKMERFWL
jgi:hypothetical protein